MDPTKHHSHASSRSPAFAAITTPTRTTSFQDLLLHPSQVTTTTTMHYCPASDCGRQFSRKYTLTEHMKTHTGEKPHVCPVRTCNKRFSTSGNLARHKRLHGFIQPIECPVEGCVCTFPSDNKLAKHMKFHYGGSVQVCEVLGCGKTFSTTGNLNRHMKNQHPDMYNPNTTPTSTKNATALMKSPTSAEDWSHSSSNGNDDNDDDDEKSEEGEDVEDDSDDEQRQYHERQSVWLRAFVIKNESATAHFGRGIGDDEANEDTVKADATLDALSLLLQDTDIAKSSSRQSTNVLNVSSPSSNIFDDIIRFHVEDLGGYDARN